MKNAINNLYKRKYILAAIVIGVVIAYTIKLFFLQVVNHDYKDFADNNAFFYKTSYPARGAFYDRNGKLLVFNQPTYDIVYIPREVQAFDTLEFCNILNIEKDHLLDRFAKIKDKRRNPGYSTYTMQTLLTQLGTKESSLLQEKLYKFPGFFIQSRTLRQYNYTNAGLLLGYVSEVDKRQMENDSYYSRGDYGGKSGLEASYEKIIRGEKGYEILLRDARGRLQGKYEDGAMDKEPAPGKDLTLSIDIELQDYAEYLLQNKIGSIVMIEPSTGEVLCMATSPSYDPSLLLGHDFSRNYLELIKDPTKPLYNRAIQGTYPPGSVFKATQGAMFLQEGAITPTSAYPCAHGYIPLNGRPACHGHESPIAIERAIATSCNAFFCYGLTNMLHSKKYDSIQVSFNKWRDYMVDMGFGYPLGIDLPGESAGLIPNSEYYNKMLNTHNWRASYILSIAIGQGEVTTTPLQIANLAATVANRGYFYTPHLVKGIKDSTLAEKYTEKRDTGIDSKHWDLIAEGMAKAVTGGTSRRANLAPEFEVCGKTGTAQNSHGQDHSWFMAFAPKKNPKVAISVMIENGGFGATAAVPITRLMLLKHLKGEIPESEKYLEQAMSSKVLLPAEYYKWKKNKSSEIIRNAVLQNR